jgi:ferredoxin
VKVEINYDTCLKNAKCYFFHPELFREGDEGWPEVVVGTVEDTQLADVQDAVDACPTGSISIVQEARETIG